MAGMGVADKLGVYVSVPFCRAKCSFCNFASGVGGAEVIEQYVATLCGEIARVGENAAVLGAELPRVVDTVYLGGGTPSLLEPEQIQRIFAALRNEFEIEAGAEITLESAPGQIEDALLDEALRLGVNRVSLGVQSFVDRECKAVGRLHTGEDCVREILRLRERGLRDVGADLIAGLPYQTQESWRRSLNVAGELAAEGALTHLSVYLLEIDEDSRLGREVLGGGARIHAPAVASDELAVQSYEMACEALPQFGFAQYEISNFAQAGFQSRHNRKYWERKPYVGVGLDAHSMLLVQGPGARVQGPEDIFAVRFANADELGAYNGRDSVEVTRVGDRESFEESVFLGLRMCEGLDLSGLRHDFVFECENAVGDLEHEGLMVVEEGRWKLTQRGRLVSNEVFGRVLEEIGFRG
jgi:oxygen-independent coproporphyrinogen-3 oxidase